MHSEIPLNQPLDVKFIVETTSGKLLKKPGQILVTKTSIEFLKSPFELKDEIKSMKGAKWHGFEDPPRKIWTAANCFRNWVQLRLLLGEDVYGWFDQPVKQHEYQRPLMDHQKDLTDSALTYHYQIWGAEMGCVDGNAVVHCSRAKREFKITLADLYLKWAGRKNHFGVRGQNSWDSSVPTKIRSLCGDTLLLNIVVDVLSKGVKDVVKVTLASGKCIRVTPDHEICTGYGQYMAAEKLIAGDTVLSTNKDNCFVPVIDTVVSVVKDGTAEVYDLVMADPHRNFVADGVVVANCGKTLSAIELMERSGKRDWFWVGPKSGLYAVEREFKKWNVSDAINMEVMTYEGLVKKMLHWPESQRAPMGVIFDESSKLKTPTAKRTLAAQALADGIRKDWGNEGFVILMSGTPSPKSPLDWWSPAEVAWPGFLKEGSLSSFEFRLGIHHKEMGVGGVAFHKLVCWRDDAAKCDICGEVADEGKHIHLIDNTNSYMLADPETHAFKPCKNEVAYLAERLKGLAIIKQKKDCLDLPDKRYRVINCTPKPSTLRVAQSLLQAAPNTITGLTWLRELSDGFQYRNKVVGKTVCPVCNGTGKNDYWVDPEDTEKAFTMVEMLDPVYVATLEKQEWTCASCDGTGEVDKIERTVKEVPCPKEEALISLLEENEETGRMVVFAAFTGSIDKVTGICLKNGWDVVRVDGRGWLVYTKDGQVNAQPLDYWADMVNNPRVVFVAHPKSGGMGLTLVEARMAVYYSNSFDPESRTQSEDRIHRIGLDINKGATIVDLIHLPTDTRVLEVLKDNRRLELMSMGDVLSLFEEEI
jgi:hypothetical protein